VENTSLNYKYIVSRDVIECKTTYFRISFLKEIGRHIGCSIRYSAFHGVRYVVIYQQQIWVYFVSFQGAVKRHLQVKSVLIHCRSQYSLNTSGRARGHTTETASETAIKGILFRHQFKAVFIMRNQP